MAAKMARPATAAPAPMPAFAPVESSLPPELWPSWESPLLVDRELSPVVVNEEEVSDEVEEVEEVEDVVDDVLDVVVVVVVSSSEMKKKPDDCWLLEVFPWAEGPPSKSQRKNLSEVSRSRL